jgi:hypothetical protein
MGGRLPGCNRRATGLPARRMVRACDAQPCTVGGGAAQRAPIPLGIFYTADGGVASDLEWAQSAVRRFSEIESALNLHPDTALFATWTHYPEHVLPENQAGTLMNVLQYLRASPSLRYRSPARTSQARFQAGMASRSLAPQ